MDEGADAENAEPSDFAVPDEPTDDETKDLLELCSKVLSAIDRDQRESRLTSDQCKIITGTPQGCSELSRSQADHRWAEGSSCSRHP